MHAVHRIKKFEKKYTLMIKRRYDVSLLKENVFALQIPKKFPHKNMNHELVGNLEGFRKHHILDGRVLMYRQTETDKYLIRTRTHNDLF